MTDAITRLRNLDETLGMHASHDRQYAASLLSRFRKEIPEIIKLMEGAGRTASAISRSSSVIGIISLSLRKQLLTYGIDLPAEECEAIMEAVIAETASIGNEIERHRTWPAT